MRPAHRQKSLIVKLTTPNPDRTRRAFHLLRSLCPLLPQRIILGRAYRNGWQPTTLIDLAGTFFFPGHRGQSPCRAAYHRAIQIGSEHVFNASVPWNAPHMMTKAPPIDADWPNTDNKNKKN